MISLTEEMKAELAKLDYSSLEKLYFTHRNHPGADHMFLFGRTEQPSAACRIEQPKKRSVEQKVVDMRIYYDSETFRCEELESKT